MLYSIIIPHYNSISSLKKLLKTIPDRRDIEILIIDDNSDNSNLKDEITHTCTIKHFINNSNNKGAGACRNIGLKNAVGDWLLFADADDYFTEDAFKNIELEMQDGLDIVFFTPTSRCLVTNSISDRHIIYSKLVTNYLVNNNSDLRYRFIVPWSKVYRRIFIVENGITFDEVLASNDVMFSLKAGHLATNIAASKLPIYCVTRGKNTLTVSRKKHILLSRFNVEMDRLDYLKKHKLNTLGNSVTSLLLKYKKLFSYQFIITIIRAYSEEKISLFPGTYIGYLKSPKKIINRIKKSKTSDKCNKYQ